MQIQLSKAEMEKLKEVVGELLEKNLGEITNDVHVQIQDDHINVVADCIITPAERIMMQKDKNRNLFLFYKIKQYNIIKSAFLDKIEKIINYKIEDTSTKFAKNGVRTITIWLGNRLD
jgi:uncharacterized protein YbcI